MSEGRKFQIAYSIINFGEATIGLLTLGRYYPDWIDKYVTRKMKGRK